MYRLPCVERRGQATLNTGAGEGKERRPKVSSLKGGTEKKIWWGRENWPARLVWQYKLRQIVARPWTTRDQSMASFNWTRTPTGSQWRLLQAVWHGRPSTSGIQCGQQCYEFSGTCQAGGQKDLWTEIVPVIEPGQHKFWYKLLNGGNREISSTLRSSRNMDLQTSRHDSRRIMTCPK